MGRCGVDVCWVLRSSPFNTFPTGAAGSASLSVAFANVPGRSGGTPDEIDASMNAITCHWTSTDVVVDGFTARISGASSGTVARQGGEECNDLK